MELKELQKEEKSSLNGGIHNGMYATKLIEVYTMGCMLLTSCFRLHRNCNTEWPCTIDCLCCNTTNVQSVWVQ